MSVPIRYRVTWTPFDAEMREALLRPVPGPIHYDGPEVEAFEAEAAAYLGVDHAVAVASGTAALHLALLALDIGPGDEVLMGANAYVALPECTLQLGAQPVYCDVRAETANPDRELLEPLVSDRSKAILIVHYFGNPVDLDPILELARERDLFVIEDVAHALGGEYKGRKLGTLGDIGFASFARKIIHVAGQGGMAFSGRADLADRMRRLRKHGWELGDEELTRISELGYNYSFSECLAAVGRVGLSRIERYWQERERNALRYSRALEGLGVPARPLLASPWGRHGRLHYVIRVPQRDELKTYLADRGVECKVHYRQPVYRLPHYLARSGRDPGPRPVTDRLAREMITLPSHPDMGEGVDEIVGMIAEFYATASGESWGEEGRAHDG